MRDTRVLPNRSSVLALLDEVEEPLALFTARGREVHQNRALRRLLRRDPQLAAGLMAAVRRSILRLLDDPTTGSRECRYGCYAICTSTLPATLLGERSALAHIHGPPRLPSANELSTRHGLTEREAEVARLMARGLTARDIAAQLQITPTTARRHAERVLQKLGLHSRAAVALRLLAP